MKKKSGRIGVVTTGLLCLVTAYAGPSWGIVGFGAGQSLDAKEALAQARASDAPDAPRMMSAVEGPFDHDSLPSFVRRHARALDWAALAQAPGPVLLLGETHMIKAHRREIASHIAEFRSAGYTHLAVELPADSYAPELEDFQRSRVSEDDLSSRWQQEGVLSAAELTALLRAARDAGLRLAAVDMAESAQVQALDDCLRGSPDKVRQHGICAERLMDQRNQVMAEAVDRLLRRSPGARVLILLGSKHVHRSAVPASLGRLGWTSRSYRFLDEVASDLDGAVEKAGLASRRLLIPPPPGLGSVDGLIWVPGSKAGRSFQE